MRFYQAQLAQMYVIVLWGAGYVSLCSLVLWVTWLALPTHLLQPPGVNEACRIKLPDPVKILMPYDSRMFV